MDGRSGKNAQEKEYIQADKEMVADMEKVASYDSGWVDGYDSNEDEWAMRTMAIATLLLDRVDTDANNTGRLDIEAIEAVTLAFWQYAENGWVTEKLGNYIRWCEGNGTARDMKKLMELKTTGRISNA
jgi:hypothetical protein